MESLRIYLDIKIYSGAILFLHPSQPFPHPYFLSLFIRQTRACSWHAFDVPLLKSAMTSEAERSFAAKLTGRQSFAQGN